jgi:hypothetical protein
MRSITFSIPNTTGNNGGELSITLSEQPDGSILCELTTLGGKNLNLLGLFFDVNTPSLLGKLAIGGPSIVSTKIENDNVSDFGGGINMHGSNGGTFDVGLSFGKESVTSATFTLSTNDGSPITLDELAHVEFGARFGNGGGKATIIAPAAPDAHDDITTALEDVSTTFNILVNDTDADVGDILSVTSTSDPAHGSIHIAADGSTITYVSDNNYSGTDTFTYEISDGNGGNDSATVSVEVSAQADAPNLNVQYSAGAAVNEINVHVSAAVTDDSEFIDRFVFTGLPAGVTVLGASGNVYDVDGTPGTAAADFTLVLQPGQEYDFDLGVEAYSVENSNGHAIAATQTKDIVVDANSTTGGLSFAVQDQSIWNSGPEFQLEDHRFIGIDEGFDKTASLGPISAHIGASLKTGFQSDLVFEGGDVDATLPYDVTINTTYNKTTDVLLIDPNITMANGGSFQTTGPEGSYSLDFIFNYFLGAEVLFDALVHEFTIYGASFGDTNTEELIDISTTDTLEIPLPFGLTGTVKWPDVDTTSQAGAGTLTSNGASNDFLHLNLDVDQALADIFLAGVNPFEIPFDFAVVDGVLQLVDLDISGGLNFLQEFILNAPNLEGHIVFENGAAQAFNGIDNIVLANASSYDADLDGAIEFGLQLTPDATLQNDTDLGINLGYNFDLLRVTGSYDIEVDSGNFDFAAVDEGGELQVATIDIFDQTFDLHFGAQHFDFIV